MLTETAFDALNRPTLVTQPDGSLHRPGYNDAGMLSKMEVQLVHESSYTEYVENIEYDANSLTLPFDEDTKSKGLVEAIPLY